MEAGLLLNERFADLPDHDARLVYIALLLACDSHGCLEDAPRALVAQLFPLLGWTAEDIDARLWALVDVLLIDRLQGEPGRWIKVRKWDEKQGGKIRRRGASRWPAKGEPRLPEQSRTTPGPVPATPHVRAAARSQSLSLLSLSETSGVTEIPTSPQKEEGATAPGASRPPSPPRGKRKKPPIPWRGEIPEGLRLGEFPELWDLWLIYRADQHKDREAVTQLSGDMALRALLELGLKRACVAIRHTIASGWKGIREPDARNGSPDHEESLEDMYARVNPEEKPQ